MRTLLNVLDSTKTKTMNERTTTMKYCDTCGKEVEPEIVIKEETYNVYGEAIHINAKVLICPHCGEEFFSEELDNMTLVNVYNEYRKRHNLLMPEEIRQIREQYGLSQRSFAKLLNWGDKTICRYENGSVQDKAHNNMLLFLRDPENMKTYLKMNETGLNTRQKDKLVQKINLLEQNEEHYNDKRMLDAFCTTVPSEENGFRAFDYDKFCAMVLFFANKDHELLKTKLMKLLNYSDMIYYKENGISISGVRYAHLPYGPVPENSDILFGTMESDHIIHIDVAYENGYEKHRIVPDEEIPPNILSDNELAVLERVYNKFAEFGSVEISEYSHCEKGYIETCPGEMISYEYARYMDFDNQEG